ncbi:tetratricopeptide repeat protein [Embleya sp. NPDC050493]|uniref:tetratricopeptide repeat protein n=1 Tax=Embleya sp. NPDC050493 TaxID=3363989 RepID=UPI0037A39515
MLVQGQHVTLRLPRDVPDALRGLPPAPGVFTGRERELADVAALVAPFVAAGGEGGRAVSVVAGMAGVGKTALALRAAHDVVAAGWFSGGAMFLGLRGYGDARLDADAVAVEMLGILGVPAEVIPAGAQARLAVVRTVLAGFAEAGHRVLIVLDDASSGDQVLPVLPGTTTHPVLVTSRHTLTGLDAPTIELRTLPDRAALDLLAAALHARRPGDSRLRRNTRAARALVGVCAGLPLALRVVAGRLAASPDLAAGVLAVDLADGARRLEGLDDGERAVRTVLDLAYEHLLAADANAATVLCLAAENPGPTFTVDAAAALSGLDRTIVMRALAELDRAHLVEPAGTGRRRMHDLVRLHAHSIPDPNRERAVHGLIAYYNAGVDEFGVAAGASPAQGVSEAAAASTARGWFAAEYDGLRAALEHAAGRGEHDTVLGLALGVDPYLIRIRDFGSDLRNLHLALRAAEALSSPHRAAQVLNRRGSALWKVRRFEEAIVAHERARELFRATDDPNGEARAWNNLGNVLGEVRRFEEAIVALERAGELFRATDNPNDEARAWHNLGSVLQKVRRFEEAIVAHERARDLFRATDDPNSEANAWNNLGIAWREVRRFEEAVNAHERARELFRATDDPNGEARAWNHQGSVLREVRRFEEAIVAHERAGDLFRATDDPNGEATAWGNLGSALREVRRFEEAIVAHERARDLFRATDDPNGQAHVWTHLGLALWDVRRFEEAIAAHERARDLSQATDDPNGEANAWNNLGIALREVRRFEEAIVAHERARDLFRATDDPHNEAAAWGNLGIALWQVRRFEEAIVALERARDLFRATDDPDTRLAVEILLRSVWEQVQAIETSRDHASHNRQAPPSPSTPAFTGSLTVLFPKREEPPPGT